MENADDNPKNQQLPNPAPDLEEDYANNTYIETSVWDLKIIFGQINQFGKPTIEVDWHTAITMPWAQAKLLNYFLGLHIASYELQNGKIKIPPAVTPPEAIEPQGDDLLPKALHELIKKRRDELLADT